MNHVSEETMTANRMLPSAIMSEKKHGLLVGCYPRKSCQRRSTDYWPDVTLVNHVSDEPLTANRMLPSGIVSATKHCVLVERYPWNHVSYETLLTSRMLP